MAEKKKQKKGASQVATPIAKETPAPVDTKQAADTEAPAQTKHSWWRRDTSFSPDVEELHIRTLLFALFFLLLTAGFFAVYAYAGSTLLHNLLVISKGQDVELTRGGLLSTALAIPLMLFFGIAQFFSNIVAIIANKRLLGQSKHTGANVLFIITFVLSLLLFIALLGLAIAIAVVLLTD